VNISIQRVTVTAWSHVPWLGAGVDVGFPQVLFYGASGSGKTSLLNMMYNTYMQALGPNRRDGTEMPEVSLVVHHLRETRLEVVHLTSSRSSASARRFLPVAIRLPESRGPTRSTDYSLSGQRIAEVAEYCEHHKYHPRILFLDMPDIGLDDQQTEAMAQRLSSSPTFADQVFVTSSRTAFVDAWRGTIVRLKPS